MHDATNTDQRTTTANPDRTGAERHDLLDDTDYVLAVFDHLGRRVRGTHRDDIVQRCVLRLMDDLDRYRMRYPVPAQMAAALARTGHADMHRSERIQRCLGARANGHRTIVDDSHLDEMPQRDSGGRDSLEAVELRAELRPLLAVLPERIRTLVWLVRVEGRDVTEAAQLLGWSRGHASRQLSKVEQRWRQARAGWV
jgi:RNA polymerase sigma factor (sigma-70 family)